MRVSESTFPSASRYWLVVRREDACPDVACWAKGRPARLSALLLIPLGGNAAWAESAAIAVGHGRYHRYLDRFFLPVLSDSRGAQELIQRFFRAIAKSYDTLVHRRQNRANIRFMLSEVGRFMPKSHRGRVLDFGCGTGLSFSVARQLGFDIVGLDVSPEMRRSARAQGMTVLTPRQLVLRRPGAYGAIVASYVFHVLTNTDDVLMAWSKMTAGGVLLGNCHKGTNRRTIETAIRRQGGAPVVLAHPPDGHGPYVAFRK
jgi:SAM-dependent methyltransferase